MLVFYVGEIVQRSLNQFKVMDLSVVIFVVTRSTPWDIMTSI